MLGKLNTIIVCLLGICLSLPIAAQQYGYVQYNAASEAPFGEVSTVIQDKVGFVWIGSENGLYRFDGVHFDKFSMNTQSQSIHQICERDSQLLFVNDIGIYQIDNLRKQPKVSPILEGTIDKKPNLPFYPNDLFIAKNQTIWLSQSNHSIGQFQKGKFKTHDFSKTKKEQQFSIQQDEKGNIWALSPIDGLFVFDTKTKRFEQKLTIKNGNALLIHDDYLLIGNEALQVYNINGSQLKLIKTIDLNNDLVTALYVDKNKQYFIGTKQGKLLTLADLNSSLQTVYGASEAHRVEELDFGNIHKIYITTDKKSDKDNLWICSENGLWLLQERFFKTVNNLPMVNPIAIQMGNQGQAWSPISYLYEISPNEDEFSAASILDNLQVSAVTQDKDGFLWVATAAPNVELRKYSNKNVVKRYDFTTQGEAIFNLYSDSKSNIWFCRAPSTAPVIGIAQISNNGQVKYYDETKGFSSRVLAIKESVRGEIYAAGIGEKSYLYRYDAQKNEFINLSPKLPFVPILNFEVHDLTIDDRGIVWLATTDGLLRYDGEKVALIQNDILGQEEVRGVTHYANNNIWVSTATKGLVFHRGNTSTNLGEIEGLPSIISAYRCISTDAQGRLWAGTAEGLVYSKMSAALLPFSNTPTIRKVLVNRKELTTNFQKLKIKKGQQLQLHFTNLSYPAKNVEYQYRLVLAEDKALFLKEQSWKSIGNSNQLTFNKSDLGTYSLELRARQSGGYQWSKPIEIPLTIFLPWYLQKWFVYGLIGLLVLGISYYFRFFIQRRFNRLQDVLNYSRAALAKKELQLNQKMQEFKEQQAELDNANSNIETLELFIKDIPKKASWNDIITAMSKAVNQSDEINAFEIAFKEGNEIVHKGFSNQERSGYTFRSQPFDAKSSLACWAMTNNKEVLINDFEKGTWTIYRRKSSLSFPFFAVYSIQIRK